MLGASCWAACCLRAGEAGARRTATSVGSPMYPGARAAMRICVTPGRDGIHRPNRPSWLRTARPAITTLASAGCPGAGPANPPTTTLAAVGDPDPARRLCMLSRRARGAALSGALALLLLILPAQAMAIEPSSQITTPAGTTYLFDESGSKLKVSGTAEGVTEVSIRCYTGPTSYGGELAGKVKVETGAFSAEVSTEGLFTMP